MGLVGSGKPDTWKTAAHDESPAARMGVLLAMRRRRRSGDIAAFLSDPDPRVVLEAARAINDVPITGALAEPRREFGSRRPRPYRSCDGSSTPISGSASAEHAAALAESRRRVRTCPPEARVLALEMLAEWAKPSGRDKVMGLWRPIPPRPSQPAADALRPKLTALLASSPGSCPNRGRCRHRGILDIKDAGIALAAIATDREQPDQTRTEALKALDQLADPGRIEAAQRALLLPGSQQPHRSASGARQGRSRRGDRSRFATGSQHGTTAERARGHRRARGDARRRRPTASSATGSIG